METEYLTCAETAKMIRAELKAAFPNIKFGVRSKTYSGGASIDIDWTDGPTAKQVEHITWKFEGRSFDGMIDMGVSNYAYIMPDGSVQWGGTPGTEGSMGVIPADYVPQPIKGRRVHFGASYVFTSRQYSKAFLTGIAEAVSKKYGKTMPAVIDNGRGAYMSRDGDERLNDWNYETIGERIHKEIQEVAA